MAHLNPFGKLPARALTDIEPYKLEISASNLQDMKQLLSLTRLAGPIYENSPPDSGRRLGLRRDWLVEAKRVWETDFDWRASENHINSFPNFRVPISDTLGTFEVHFVALFSSLPNAVPIVLLHGWPGSFLEFLPLLNEFRQTYSAETLPYHLIVPSLPGYTLSSMPLLDQDLTQVDVARIVNTLMQHIGFGEGYVAQGGDVGSRVARFLGVNHKECKAVHLNFCPMSRPASESNDSALTQLERDGIARMGSWTATGTAYALEQATKPSTLGFVLESNPIALLAWIGEKFLDWPEYPLPVDTILEAASLYWLTRCAHSNLWSYRHSFGPHPITHDDPKYFLKVPLGYSYYPKEVMPIPPKWVATTGNLVWSRINDKGGHFAALEQPKVFMEDLEAFVKEIWD